MPKAKATPKPAKNLVVVPASSGRSYAEISKDISTLVTAFSRLDITAHNIAVETLAHAAEHGDYTLFAQLIGNCHTAGGVTFGKGAAPVRKALIEWATKFSPIRLNGDGLIGILPVTAKAYVPFNIEGATETPFYEMPNAKADRKSNTPFDIATIMGRIGSFYSAIDKAVEAGTLNDDETALRQFTADLNAFAAERAGALGLSSDAAKARRAA